MYPTFPKIKKTSFYFFFIFTFDDEFEKNFFLKFFILFKLKRKKEKLF